MKSAGESFARQFKVKRVYADGTTSAMDSVAAEEPLEIRIRYWFKNAQISQSLAVTMRTPGHDRELAAGFLLSEGIIQNASQLVELRSLGIEPSNEILAELARDVDFETWKAARNSFVSSSCGICGKRSRDALGEPSRDPPRREAFLQPNGHISNSLIAELPERMRARQTGFAQTGGLHAAALVSCAGQVEAAFEDIGRHNALDKLIGHCLLSGWLPIENRIIFISSRSSFELAQKAIMAGATVLATVGGPSSLAIETARECGLTLIGFVREGHFNVYSGEWRLDS